MTALACLACFAAHACALRPRLASKDELDEFEKEMKGAKAEDGAELVGEASDHSPLHREQLAHRPHSVPTLINLKTKRFGVKYRPIFLSRPQTP